jgi:hypothetical protein
MKRSTFVPLFAASVSFTLLTAAIDLSSVPRKTTAQTVPGAYIVELDPNAVGPTGKRSANVTRFHSTPSFFH